MLRPLLLVALVATSALAAAQERIRDVIYAKSGGAAFTMDVFKPKEQNGGAVIFLVSGGWVSDHNNINPLMSAPFNAGGLTVFQIVHGAQPKYTIPEINKQVTRAIRFIHANAEKYGVDPNRLGLMGASAGGHLSLMAGGTMDSGNPTATDPIDRAPSTVAAIVAVFPPTDFLNYGEHTSEVLKGAPLFAPFRPAFGIPANATDEQINAIAKAVSPIYLVTSKFPPTMLVHGDEDPLVPLQQSLIMLDALKKAGVDSELIVVKGGKHDGVTIAQGAPHIVRWFTEKLKKKS